MGGESNIPRLRQELEDALDQARRRLSALGGGARRWSWGRLGLFVAAAGCAGLGIHLGLAGLAWAAAGPGILFVVAVARHEQLKTRQAETRAEADLLAEKLARMQSVAWRPVHRHRLVEHPSHPLDQGRREEDASHDGFDVGPYLAKDLDLVEGPSTLRDLLDSTQTSFGFRRLHACLLRPLTDAGEIRRRQGAVRELVEGPGLRREAARLLHPMRERSLDFLTEFLAEPLTLAPTRAALASVRLLGGLGAAAVVAAALGGVPWSVAAAVLTLNFGVASLNVKRVVRLRWSVYALEAWTRAMERFGPLVARKAWSSPLLAGLSGRLSGAGEGPRRAGTVPWGRLRRGIRLLHGGDYGILSFLWNLVTLWDVQIGALVERGFKERRDRILEEAGALGEWEMLAAFANLMEERGDYSIPEIAEGEGEGGGGGGTLLEIEGGRHPYLEREAVVANDVDLRPGRNLLVVTGSNMAGKSTYLRMTALNVLLAQIGAPVRADRMLWTPVRLFTVIDVEDDLVHGQSYFRVEVGRVKEVLDHAARSSRVLAVFDELFRGTNSVERVAAGREILRSLAATGGLFVMATHDMEYTALAGEVGGARNVHFAEVVTERGIEFHYGVLEGPAATRNALRVLEACGIPSDIVRRAAQGLP